LDLKTRKVWVPWDVKGTELGLATSIALLPDGRFVLGDRDGKILLWNPQNRKAELVKPEPDYWNTDEINELVLLPDGRLVSASEKGAVLLWDLETGKSKVLRQQGDGRLSRNRLIVLPEGRLVLARSELVEVWNLSSAGADRAEQVLQEGKEWVPEAVQLVGGRLPLGAEDGTIEAWNPKTGRIDAILSGHTKQVNQLILLLDGKVASASRDGTIRIWNLDALSRGSKL
jgi:WD40 repeat protein